MKKFWRGWHICRYVHDRSEEHTVKTWLNGGRKVATTMYYKCIHCGKVKKSWMRLYDYVAPGETTLKENIAEMKSKLDRMNKEVDGQLTELERKTDAMIAETKTHREEVEAARKELEKRKGYT